MSRVLGLTRHRVTLGACLAVYCLWPAREALLSGLPLAPLGLAGLGAISVALLLRASGHAGALGLALVLLSAKVLVAPLTIPSGWAAWYYANADLLGTWERSTEFIGQPWTRLERRLQFEGPTFPVHFQNTLRLNFADDRRAPPLSARYMGYIHVSGATRLRLRVASMSGYDVMLDGRSLLSRPATEATLTEVSTEQALAPGSHRIEAHYFVPAFRARKFVLDGELIGDGATRDVHSEITPIEVSPTQASRGRVVRWLGRFMDVVVLLGIAAWIWRGVREWRARLASDALAGPRVVLVAGAVVGTLTIVSLQAWWQTAPAVFVTVPTGADAMAYEDYARRAVLDSWLLDAGSLENTPFLYTIGYHYVMTASHVLFGESLLAVYFVQDVLLWAAILLTAGLAAHLSNWRVGVVTLLAGWYLREYLIWFSTDLYRENLVIFLNAALLFGFASNEKMTTRRAAGLGALAGFNVLSDPINLLVLPLMLVVIRHAAQESERRRCMTVFAVAWLALFLIVPVRNLIVAGVPIVLPTEGAPTLWWGNRPPPDVAPEPAHHEFYQVVLRYALSEPWHFIAGLVRKAVYSLGFYSVLNVADTEEIHFSGTVLAIWVCAAFGLLPAIRRHAAAGLLIAMVLVRWSSIVVFIADHNVDRYEVTLAVLMLPLATIGLSALWRAHPLAPALVVAAVAVHHYVRVAPDTGNARAFTSEHLLASASYHAQRRTLAAGVGLAGGQTFAWTFPRDLREWSTGDSIAIVDDETPTIQNMTAMFGGVFSPPLKVPAPLVREVAIEAGFTGWAHTARLFWDRSGVSSPSIANFRVDNTGRIRTYRIPVARSADWQGTIERLRIYYQGDAIAPRRIELVTYPDVVLPSRPPSP